MIAASYKLTERQARAALPFTTPQIRAHHSWDASKHIRLICSGKELHPEDPVSRANASVLHCIATDGVPAGYAASRKAAHAMSVEQPPLDMVGWFGVFSRQWSFEASLLSARHGGNVQQTR